VGEENRHECGIMAHDKMVKLYNGKVSPQAKKLKTMVEEKKIGKKGEGKKSVYIPA
jgi:hypothetical protein